MRFRFWSGSGDIDFLASCVPIDSFHEFVTAAYGTYRSGSSNKVRFNCEPTEFDLVIERRDDWLVLSTVGGIEDTTMATGFETGCREIAKNLFELLERVGYDGFVRDWGERPPDRHIIKFWGCFN